MRQCIRNWRHGPAICGTLPSSYLAAFCAWQCVFLAIPGVCDPFLAALWWMKCIPMIFASDLAVQFCLFIPHLSPDDQGLRKHPTSLNGI